MRDRPYDDELVALSADAIATMSLRDTRTALRRLGVEWVPYPDSPFVRQTAQARECLALLAGTYQTGVDMGIPHGELLAAMSRVLTICGAGVARGAAVPEPFSSYTSADVSGAGRGVQL